MKITGICPGSAQELETIEQKKKKMPSVKTEGHYLEWYLKQEQNVWDRTGRRRPGTIQLPI